MNRILLVVSLVIGASLIGSSLLGHSSTAQDGSGHRKVPVRTLEEESSAASATPAPASGTMQSQTGNASATGTGLRDYRRELQYDSSILEIRSQLHGVARPQQNAVMSSLVPGRVMTIHHAEGDRVSAGDILVSLDDRLANAQVASARIEAERRGTLQRAEIALKQSTRRLERLQQAALKSATASFEIEEARSLMEQAEAERDGASEGVAVAEANLKLAEEQLRRNSVHAPFDGVVVQVHQKVGSSVDQSLPLVTLANLDILEVEMYVPIDRFGSLHVGGFATLQASAPVNQELTAEVRSVSSVIDSASGTFRCLLQIDNHNGKLPAGFSVLLTGSASTPSTVAEIISQKQ